ncbi:MAG: type IV pilin-like G/H family protein [Prochlorothrix sp.]|nr:type IV pilin-like G/H family protein [Prochlorothrix sp.]
MTSPSVYELAKLGEPSAIVKLLDKAFVKGGVTVAKCDRQGSTLRILLIGEKIDKQQRHAIEFLQKQFIKLEIVDLSEVIVYGQKTDDVMPVWNETISLNLDSTGGFDDFYLEDDETNHADTVTNNTEVTVNSLLDQPPPISQSSKDLPPPLPVSPPPISPRPPASRSSSTAKPRKPPMPPSRLGLAIASIFFFFPLGIAALVISNQVSSKYHYGDYAGARSSSNAVKFLFIISTSIVSLPILIAIALPSFLNQANEARESEGKQYVGSMNRGQQAYYLERSRFTDDIGTLGLGIQSETTNYIYEIEILSDDQVISTATPKNSTLKGFTGSVALVEVEGNTGGYKTTVAILCESNRPSSEAPDPPILLGSSQTCASGSKTLE